MGKIAAILLSLAMATALHANAQSEPGSRPALKQEPGITGTVEAIDLGSRTISLLGQLYSVPFGTPIMGFGEKGTTNLGVIEPGMGVRLKLAPGGSPADPSRVTSISVIPD